MNDGAMDPKDVFPLTALEKMRVRALSTVKAVHGVAIDQPQNSSTSGSPPTKAPKAVPRHVINQPGTSNASDTRGRGSSGREVALVDYHRLHEGGSVVASVEGSRARPPIGSHVQSPNDLAFPLEHRSEGLFDLIGSIKSTGDWDHVLRDLSRD